MRETRGRQPELAASVRAYLRFCPAGDGLATPAEHLWRDYQLYGGRVGFREFLRALVELQLFRVRPVLGRFVVEGVAPDLP